jgi:hypothetical protein
MFGDEKRFVVSANDWDTVPFKSPDHAALAIDALVTKAICNFGESEKIGFGLHCGGTGHLPLVHLRPRGVRSTSLSEFAIIIARLLSSKTNRLSSV